MTIVLIVLALLTAVLCTSRETSPDTRTWSDMRARARANGWKRGTLLAVGGTAKLLLLLAGALLLVTFTIAAKTGHGLWFLCTVLGEHLLDLLNQAKPLTAEAS